MAREVIQSVSPFCCRMWDCHDRLESHITEESCKAEIESFMRHGQMVPALARRLLGDPTHDYELIYGARRLFVARYLNRPLLVEVRALDDREAIIAMDIENRHRQDISAYERGLSYANWLRSGMFTSQDDIAKSLKISASQVSRLLKLARLPSVIVNAFSSGQEICETWGLELAEALEDGQRRQTIISRARLLVAKSPRLRADIVFKELLLSGQSSGRVKKASHDEVVRDRSGAPLFRVRQQRNTIALVLPISRLSPAALDHIRRAVADVIERHGVTQEKTVVGRGSPAFHRSAVRAATAGGHGVS